MSLTRQQVDALLTPISHGRIRQVQGNDHLEAWDVRRWLLRIFGWGGWDFIVKDCTLVSERSMWDEHNPLRGRHTVVYRVIGQLVIKDPEGVVLATFEDGATGDSQNQPSLGAAHDQALKTAMSQALKRCAVNLGDTYGLVLYSKARPKEDETFAVVGRSLAHEGSAQHSAMEEVGAGELDTPQAGEEAPATSSAQVTSSDSPSRDTAGRNAPAAPSSISPDEATAQQEATAAEVQRLREAALAVVAPTFEGNRQDALITLTKLNLQAGKQRLLQQPVRRESGEEVTFELFFGELLKRVSRSAA